MEPNGKGTDLVNLNLAIAATPEITFVKAPGVAHKTESKTGIAPGGFAIDLETATPYAALSPVLHSFLIGKRFEVSEGFLKQHIRIDACKLYNGIYDNLVVELHFSGSFSGTVYFTGTPFYNATTQSIELQKVQYDVKTSNLFLKGAKWLFEGIILEEIKKHTVLDLTPYLQKAINGLNENLVKNWGKAMQSTGMVDSLEVISIQVKKESFIMRCRCTGRLQLTLFVDAL
ncbi:MAG TPA: DUF4403 family protein, partial [Niastella sp.]|nr:DUF4403 family protein [Niastella sp.]